jgi:plasmid replication initiation protein
MNTEEKKYIRKKGLIVSNDFVNGLIRKNNKNTLKLLFYALNSNQIIREEQSNIYLSIDMKELYNIYNNDFKHIRRDFQKVQKTIITIKNENKRIRDTQLIKYVDYDLDKQLIELEIDKNIYNEFRNLKNNFTIIKVDNIVKLNNKHSLRLLLLLENMEGWSNKVCKVLEYDLEQLNNLFDTNYKTFPSLIKAVIKPIEKELNEFSYLSFTYSLRYDYMKENKGRKPIKAIRIELKNNKQVQGRLDI